MYSKMYRSNKQYKVMRLKKIILVILVFMVAITGIKYYGKRTLMKSFYNNGNVKKDEVVTNEDKKDNNEQVNNEVKYIDSDIESQLKELSKNNSKVKTILKNINEYPTDILNLLIKNPETVDFVLNYPSKKDEKEDSVVISKQYVNGVPNFKQWDQRWGYERYGDKILALSGCGPTSLSMVVMGLTGDTSATPAVIAKYSESKGYYVNGKGTSWELITKGCQKYGVTSKEVPLSEESMVKALEEDKLIICSMAPGDFTSEGHFIVIREYENGKFIVNDPNSIKLSQKKWSYDELKGQINNLWSFSASK